SQEKKKKEFNVKFCRALYIFVQEWCLRLSGGGLILYQAYGNLYATTEEIHMTWAHLEKKQARLQLYTQVDEELFSQTVETVSELVATPSGLQRDDFRNYCDGVWIVANLKKP
ncbi:hypothetical protein Tco_0863079, partial [Tanacetum coccineum]